MSFTILATLLMETIGLSKNDRSLAYGSRTTAFPNGPRFPNSGAELKTGKGGRSPSSGLILAPNASAFMTGCAIGSGVDGIAEGVAALAE